MNLSLRLAAAALALGACGPEAPQPAPRAAGPDTTTVSAPTPALALVDTAIPPAVAGEDGWNYQQTAEADLDGDGETERVVMTARVELYRGQPAWDDGQPWQVYVEAVDGTRSYLYAQRLQLGTLAMRLARGGEGRPPTIVLIEHLPDRIRVLEGSYPGPARGVTVVERFARPLDPRGETASPRLP